MQSVTPVADTALISLPVVVRTTLASGILIAILPFTVLTIAALFISPPRLAEEPQGLRFLGASSWSQQPLASLVAATDDAPVRNEWQATPRA